LGEFAQRVSLDAEVETDDVETFFSFSGKLVRLVGGDNAGELAVFHHRRQVCFAHEALFVEVDGRETRAHRAFVADVTDERAGVDAFDGDDVPAFQVRLETLFGAPTRANSARFTNDEAFDPRTRRFRVGLVDSVVADQWISHADDLAGVRWIRKDLLVTGHRGIENDLTANLSLGRPRASAKRSTVFKC